MRNYKDPFNIERRRARVAAIFAKFTQTDDRSALASSDITLFHNQKALSHDPPPRPFELTRAEMRLYRLAVHREGGNPTLVRKCLSGSGKSWKDCFSEYYIHGRPGLAFWYNTDRGGVSNTTSVIYTTSKDNI